MMRMEDQEMNKKILLAQPLYSKQRERPRTDEVDEYARIFGIRNWWMMTRDRDEWKGFLEEVNTQK